MCFWPIILAGLHSEPVIKKDSKLILEPRLDSINKITFIFSIFDILHFLIFLQGTYMAFIYGANRF